jgi:hypothetical protein
MKRTSEKNLYDLDEASRLVYWTAVKYRKIVSFMFAHDTSKKHRIFER